MIMGFSFSELKFGLFPIAFYFIMTPLLAQKDFSSTRLSSEELTMTVYHPDPQQGFYRATRFDWSGVIGSLTFAGHEYFGHWLPVHDPLNHESITGPVEAFAPLGYDEAAAGDAFVVIGVGELEKESDDPYRFAKPYKVLNTGKWKTKAKTHKVSFRQKLKAEMGYGYKYEKTIALTPDASEFVIGHDLKNTGNEVIQTSVYNHNFFVIASELSGPSIITHFSEPVKAEGRGFGDIALIDDNQLIFSRELQKGESIYTPNIETSAGTPPDYLIFIENSKAGVGVEISGDQPLEKLSYWACRTTACPEPYIKIDLQPGQTFSWHINYRFYEIEW